MSCKKAQGFLEQHGASVGETVDATKTRIDKTEAVAVARAKATKVVTAKATIDLKKDDPGDEALAAQLLGPTGNLKAPTALVGRTLVVGFNEAMYQQYLT
jgi:arsenate reductase-like glutaredoxin family protein